MYRVVCGSQCHEIWATHILDHVLKIYLKKLKNSPIDGAVHASANDESDKRERQQLHCRSLKIADA